MTDSQLISTAQESADRLAAALEGNTSALTDAVERIETRSRRTLRLVIVLALLLGIALKFNYDGIVDRCNSGNDLRSDIDERFQQVADTLAAAGVGNTPEGQELLIVLEADLVPRDCSSINWLGR